MTFFSNQSTDRPRLYASAIIGGDEILPEYWNDYFGIPANGFFAQKGKYWKTRSGKRSSVPAHKNIWGYSTKGVITSNFLADHLNHLTTMLKLPRSDLKTLVEDK